MTTIDTHSRRVKETEDGIRYLVAHEREKTLTNGLVPVAGPKGGRTTVWIVDDAGTVLAKGESVCHPEKDNFNRRLGETIALGRARKALERGDDVVLQGAPSSAVRRDLFDLAVEEADRVGICSVQLCDGGPKYVLMTMERWRRPGEFSSRGPYPQVSPEMLDR